MSLWKRFDLLLSWVWSLGIVLGSVGLLVYMFVIDAFMIEVLLTCLMSLYVSVKDLIDLLKEQES